MLAELASGDRAAIEGLVARLEAAWKAMDASAFAAPFGVDADFVNIRGERFRGRTAIATGHAAIFQTIYAGSTAQMTLESARLLRPEVALVHVHSLLDAPQGPLAGRHGARFSMVLTKEAGGWENRRVPQYAGGGPKAPPLIGCSRLGKRPGVPAGVRP